MTHLGQLHGGYGRPAPNSPAIAGTRKKILLVDHDEISRHRLGCQLRLLEEFLVVEAESGEQALDLTNSEHFDAMLIAAKLAGTDGREICRILRRRGLAFPIIVLSATQSNADEILSFAAGANDHIAEPYSFGGLLARLRTRLREREQCDEATLDIGLYQFRPAVKLLIHEDTGEQKFLTPKEAAVLKCLYHHGETGVSREALLHQVWGFTGGINTRTLDTHIYRLRRKIERDPLDPEILVTIPGGYRLAAKKVLAEKNLGRQSAAALART